LPSNKSKKKIFYLEKYKNSIINEKAQKLEKKKKRKKERRKKHIPKIKFSQLKN